MTENDSKDYCYSPDGEEFHDRFATRQGAADEGFAVHDELTVISTGEIVQAYDFLHPKLVGEDIIERVEENLYSNIPSEGEILEATSEQQEALGQVVIDWLKANVTPNRWGVRNVQEHVRPAEVANAE